MIYYGFTGQEEGDMVSHKALLDLTKKKFPTVRTVVRPRQVHGDTICVLSSVPAHEDLMSIAETDAVITGLENTALTVITADCVPAIYYDEGSRIIGISHQGWKGTLLELPRKMVERMTELGSDPKNIMVSLGPAINACCYEIPPERAVKFRGKFPNSRALINSGEHVFLSLVRLNVEQLILAGIPESNIEWQINCTSCRGDRYFSYRKSKNKEHFPEQVSYIFQTHS